MSGEQLSCCIWRGVWDAGWHSGWRACENDPRAYLKMDGNSLHDLARLVYVLSGKLEIDLQAVHSRPHHIYLCCTLPFLNPSVDIYSYPVYTLLISCLLFCTSCISLPYTSYSAPLSPQWQSRYRWHVRLPTTAGCGADYCGGDTTASRGGRS